MRCLLTYTSFPAQRRAWCATAPLRGQADVARDRPDGRAARRALAAQTIGRDGRQRGLVAPTDLSIPRGKGVVEK